MEAAIKFVVILQITNPDSVREKAKGSCKEARSPKVKLVSEKEEENNQTKSKMLRWQERKGNAVAVDAFVHSICQSLIPHQSE